MLLWTRTLAVITLLAGALTPAVSTASDVTPVGVVTTIDGHATIARASLPAATPLKLRDRVYLADRITTGDNSFARILLGGKALVTVRERSVLTITEAPGRATVDVSSGKVALAVIKDRMRAGEAIEIRTPNAVAGVRGTVVIAEVSQATSQVGAGAAAWTTTITVLTGVVEFHALDLASHQPTGAALSLGALQSIRITGAAAPRPVQTITADAAQRLANELRMIGRDSAPATSPSITDGQFREAALATGGFVGGVQPATDGAERRGPGSQGAVAPVTGAAAPTTSSGNGGSPVTPPAAAPAGPVLKPGPVTTPVTAAPPIAPMPAIPSPVVTTQPQRPSIPAAALSGMVGGTNEGGGRSAYIGPETHLQGKLGQKPKN